MTNVEAIIAHYENAKRPMSTSRAREFAVVKEYHTHWNREITEEDFDWAIAELFGGGCEYEWPTSQEDRHARVAGH